MRRKVYTVKRKWHKGDKGTVYRLFRGGKMILDLWTENDGTLIVNRDYFGIAQAMLDAKKSSMATVREPTNAQHLIGAVILREEYGTADAYFHYRKFSDAFVWQMIIVDQVTRFGSEEVFEAYLSAKQTFRDKKPGEF